MKNSNYSEFAGFDDWVPIFAGGKQTDSQGVEHDADEMITKAVQLFDAKYHEAPVVVGHPKDNSPAFGWVEGLKSVAQKLKDGSKVNVLMAKFKNVIPEFANAVQQGLYKKRSASFYQDGRLRHVGFLGGMPPAVKGLADLKFEESEQEPIMFGEQEINFSGYSLNTIVEIFRGIRDFFIGKFGQETADKAIPSYEIADLAKRAVEESLMEKDSFAYTEAHTPVDPAQYKPAVDPLFSEEGNMPESKKYSEEEMQAERNRLTAEFAEEKAKAEEEAKAMKDAEAARIIKFAEQKKELKAEIEAEFAEKARKEEIKRFISDGLKEGKIIPAWKEMGLTQFMENLSDSTPIEFGEGDTKKSESLYDFFKRFVSELPKTIHFGEHAPRSTDTGAGAAGEKLSVITTQIMEKNDKLDYSAAFAEASKRNPDLVREYEQEIRRVN